jgi:AraC family transcriptional regulator, transcriptional activator of pobA
VETFKVKEKISSNTTFKIAPFRKHIRQTEPHKHKNYFEIIFLWAGSGIHLIDSTKYEISPPTIFILKKNQIHAWNITKEPEGYVIIIKDEFIENTRDTELKVLFHLFWSIEHLALRKDTVGIRSLFENLHSEFTSEQRFSKMVVEGLLKSILGKLLQYQYLYNIDNKYIDIYAQFIELIITNKTNTRNLINYAGQLNVSVQVLNDICKNATGKSAKKMIDEFTISDAKRYLEFSNLTISEIAFKLQFNDSSYFVKFFKKHEGITPSLYREMRFQKLP